MRVKAKSTGFYNGSRKRPGAEFTLTDKKHFSKNWMEEIVEPAPKPQPDKPEKPEKLKEKPQPDKPEKNAEK